jgi:hypothetical protein
MSSPIDRDSPGPVSGADGTAIRILARSVVSELRKQGYGPRHIIALTNELIDLACEAIRSDRTPTVDT